MSSPAYAPLGESASDLWLERSNFAGVFVGGVSYGIHVAVFAAATYFIISAYKASKRLPWSFLTFIFALFTLGTIDIACNTKFGEMMWIDDRSIPGGPNAWLEAGYSTPVNVLGSVVYILQFSCRRDDYISSLGHLELQLVHHHHSDIVFLNLHCSFHSHNLRNRSTRRKSLVAHNTWIRRTVLVAFNRSQYPRHFGYRLPPCSHEAANRTTPQPGTFSHVHLTLVNDHRIRRSILYHGDDLHHLLREIKQRPEYSSANPWSGHVHRPRTYYSSCCSRKSMVLQHSNPPRRYHSYESEIQSATQSITLRYDGR